MRGEQMDAARVPLGEQAESIQVLCLCAFD